MNLHSLEWTQERNISVSCTTNKALFLSWPSKAATYKLTQVDDQITRFSIGFLLLSLGRGGLKELQPDQNSAGDSASLIHYQNQSNLKMLFYFLIFSLLDINCPFDSILIFHLHHKQQKRKKRGNFEWWAVHNG